MEFARFKAPHESHMFLLRFLGVPGHLQKLRARKLQRFDLGGDLHDGGSLHLAAWSRGWGKRTPKDGEEMHAKPMPEPE